MAQNPWTKLNDAMTGRRPPGAQSDADARRMQGASGPQRGTGAVTADEATRQRAARRQQLANEAVARAAAARGSGALSDADAARIRARFQ